MGTKTRIRNIQKWSQKKRNLTPPISNDTGDNRRTLRNPIRNDVIRTYKVERIDERILIRNENGTFV